MHGAAPCHSIPSPCDLHVVFIVHPFRTRARLYQTATVVDLDKKPEAKGGTRVPLRERRGNKRKREPGEERARACKSTCRAQAAAGGRASQGGWTDRRAMSRRVGGPAGGPAGRPVGRPRGHRAGHPVGRKPRRSTAGRKGQRTGRRMDSRVDDKPDDSASDTDDHPFEIKTNTHNDPNDQLQEETIRLVRAVQRTIDHLHLIARTLKGVASGHHQRSNRLSKIEQDLDSYVETGNYDKFRIDVQKFLAGGRKRRSRAAAAATKAGRNARDVNRTIRELEIALSDLTI